MRRQSALLHVGFWFLFLPLLLNAQFARLVDDLPYFTDRSPEAIVTLTLVYILFFLVLSWGMVCVLIVSRRLLQAKAGRTRRSFKAVRSQARSYFLPYLLTSVLRTVFTLLWMLLLVVPGIVYFIRTAFFPVIIVHDNMSYREALTKSSDLVRGQFFPVFFSLLLLGLFLFVPVDLVALLTDTMSQGAPLPITIAADIIASFLGSLATILYLIALTGLYGYYRFPQRN